jgi:hypothetical protein
MRIDALLAGPVSAWTPLTLSEWIFPAIVEARRDHPTDFQLLQAVTSDLFRFPYRLFIVTVWFLVHFVIRIPGGVLDLCRITIDVVADRDYDGSSRAKLLFIFKSVLEWDRFLIMKLYRDTFWLLKTLLKAMSGLGLFMYYVGEGLTTKFAISCNRWMRSPDESIPDYIQQQNQVIVREVVKDSYKIAANMSLVERSDMIVKNHEYKNALDQILPMVDQFREHECRPQAKGLGKKAIQYRLDLVDAHRHINHLSGFNYYKRNPELDFGIMKQIEDFAAEGRLHE